MWLRRCFAGSMTHREVVTTWPVVRSMDLRACALDDRALPMARRPDKSNND
jgi:hypothetical protein